MFVVHDREGEKGTDVRPRDELEREAKKVDPPGVSREPLNPAVVSAKSHSLVWGAIKRIGLIKIRLNREGDVRSGRGSMLRGWSQRASCRRAQLVSWTRQKL